MSPTWHAIGLLRCFVGRHAALRRVTDEVDFTRTPAWVIRSHNECTRCGMTVRR